MGRLGRWELVERLGSGGMGEVWRAVEPATGRAAAVKLLHGPHLDRELRLRFEREARALAESRDPGLVKYLEGDPVGPVPWFAMELLEGETLRAAIRRGPLPPDQALRIAARLASTVGLLHQRGIVHRDLKPENVLLTPGGQPILLDLGLAIEQGADVRLTMSGEILGTPGFLAPEQAAANKAGADPRTDVYGLGAVLHALLTGRPPSEGEGLAALNAVLTSPAQPPSALRPGLDPLVDALVLRCLARQPEERLADGSAVAAALRDLLTGRSRAARRGQGGRAIAATIALVAVGLAALLWHGGRAARLVSQGERRRRAGDVAAARSDLDRAIELEPGRGSAWLQRGHVRRTQRDGPGALSDYARAAELGPDDVTLEAHRAAAEVHELLGALGPAIESWSRAIELAPADDHTIARRAMAKHARGDLQGALEDYDRSIALRGDRTEVLASRAQARRFVGDLDGAAADLGRALELAPDDVTALINRGALRRARGQADLALVDLDRAVAVAPGRFEAWVGRSATHGMRHDYRRALADADQAIKLAPAAAPAHLNRGKALRGLGDLAGALAAMDRAIELDPSNPQLWRERATVRFRLRDPAGDRDLERALELDPGRQGFVAAHLVRAEWRALVGDLKGALAELERVLARDPTCEVALARRGLARLQSGQPGLALADFDRALASGHDLDEALIGRAQALHQEGRRSEAARDLARLETAHPLHPELPALRAALADALAPAPGE